MTGRDLRKKKPEWQLLKWRADMKSLPTKCRTVTILFAASFFISAFEVSALGQGSGPKRSGSERRMDTLKRQADQYDLDREMKGSATKLSDRRSAEAIAT